MRVDLFFFFFTSRRGSGGGRVGGGGRSTVPFSKCRRNTVLLSSHIGLITLQPTYCKAPSVRGPVKRGAVCPPWSSLSPRLSANKMTPNRKKKKKKAPTHLLKVSELRRKKSRIIWKARTKAVTFTLLTVEVNAAFVQNYFLCHSTAPGPVIRRWMTVISWIFPFSKVVWKCFCSSKARPCKSAFLLSIQLSEIVTKAFNFLLKK